jgi:hypothetical protein
VFDIVRIIITILFLLKIGVSSMLFVLLEYGLQYAFMEAQLVFKRVFQKDCMTIPLLTSFFIYLLIYIEHA